MVRIGLNPYGLAYTVGLQGLGTPRLNPRGIGLTGFLQLARDLGADCLELDDRWLAPLAPDALAGLRHEWAGASIPILVSRGLTHAPDESLAEAIGRAQVLGATTLRLHLTPVLAGDRALYGERWSAYLAHARDVLRRGGPLAEAAGLVIGIENHQDLGSEELLALADAGGPAVGIVLDTGNPFAVGEDPVAFTRRVAARVRHLHLKDYRAQFTPEGFRLVRCPIGDGAVPFEEMVAVLEASATKPLTASLEPGALEARHVRLFTESWWSGYPRRDAAELGVALGRLWRTRLPSEADYRTPWECQCGDAAIMAYERAQLLRSVRNLRAMHLGTEGPPPFPGNVA